MEIQGAVACRGARHLREHSRLTRARRRGPWPARRARGSEADRAVPCGQRCQTTRWTKDAHRGAGPQRARPASCRLRQRWPLARAVPAAAGPARDGGSRGRAPPWPCGSAAAHTPGSTRDAAPPAAHSTSASPGPAGASSGACPSAWRHCANVVPLGRRIQPIGPHDLRTPAAAHAAASAAGSPPPRASAACASRAPAHPGPDCRHTGRSPSGRPSSRSARA